MPCRDKITRPPSTRRPDPSEFRSLRLRLGFVQLLYQSTHLDSTVSAAVSISSFTLGHWFACERSVWGPEMGSVYLGRCHGSNLMLCAEIRNCQARKWELPCLAPGLLLRHRAGHEHTTPRCPCAQIVALEDYAAASLLESLPGRREIIPAQPRRQLLAVNLAFGDWVGGYQAFLQEPEAVDAGCKHTCAPPHNVATYVPMWL